MITKVLLLLFCLIKGHLNSFQLLESKHSLDPCPEDVEESVDKGTFRWPVTETGQIATLACPYGTLTTLEGKLKRPAAEISPGLVTDTEFRERQERTKFDQTTLLAAVRSCERFPNDTVGWNMSDLSVCREQRLAIAEERSAILENNSVAAKNLTLIGVEQVADEVVNLVDDALVDLKV